MKSNLDEAAALKIYFCAEELKQGEEECPLSYRWYLSPPTIAEELPDFILAPATTNTLSLLQFYS